jgi:hypothetical protein
VVMCGCRVCVGLLRSRNWSRGACAQDMCARVCVCVCAISEDGWCDVAVFVRLCECERIVVMSVVVIVLLVEFFFLKEQGEPQEGGDSGWEIYT